MSNTAQAQVAYIKETDFNTQKTGSALQILRYSGESLKQDAGVSQGEEIRGDRQIPSMRRTRKSASGGINGLFSYGTYDDLLASVLQAASWNAAVTVGPIITISAASGDNSFNDSGSGFGSLVVNQWVYVTGFTTAGNNGFFKIATKTTGKITVTGGTLVSEDAGDSVTVKQGAYIVNGVTLDTYNFERKYADLATELALLTGMALNGLSLAIPQEGDISIGFDLIGGGEQSLATTGGSGYTAATTTEKFNGLDVNHLYENLADLTVANFSLQINNNLRSRLVIGSSGILSIGSGNINVSGALRTYYTSKTLFDKWLNETATALALAISDAAGNRYVIDLPKVKFTAGARVASGPNDDCFADLQWTAYMHATEAITARIARFAA